MAFRFSALNTVACDREQPLEPVGRVARVAQDQGLNANLVCHCDASLERESAGIESVIMKVREFGEALFTHDMLSAEHIIGLVKKALIS